MNEQRSDSKEVVKEQREQTILLHAGSSGRAVPQSLIRIVVVVEVTIPDVEHIEARVLYMLKSHRRVNMTASRVVISWMIHDQGSSCGARSCRYT